MRKLIQRGLLLACTLGATVALADGPASFDDALKLATEQNKVVVADFYTDW